MSAERAKLSRADVKFIVESGTDDEGVIQMPTCACLYPHTGDIAEALDVFDIVRSGEARQAGTQ